MFKRQYGKLNIFNTLTALTLYFLFSIILITMFVFYTYTFYSEIELENLIILDIINLTIICVILSNLANLVIKMMKLKNIILFRLLSIFLGVLILYFIVFLELFILYDFKESIFSYNEIIIQKREVLDLSYFAALKFKGMVIGVNVNYIVNYISFIIFSLFIIFPKGYHILDFNLVKSSDYNVRVRCFVAQNESKINNFESLKDCKEIDIHDRYEYLFDKIYIVFIINKNLYCIRRIKRRMGVFSYNKKYVSLDIIPNKIL